MGVGGLDDVAELWLERGATDEEAVDVLLRDQFSAVLGVCRSSVLNSSGSGDGLADA